MPWELQEAHNPPYSVFTGTIKQLDNDTLQPRLIRLHNGMQILVVRDLSVEMAAVSITIRVGDIHDPHDLPGLAHFLEHILTEGSERYPEEQYTFMTYLSEYHGSYKASTSPDDSTHSIGVDNDALERVLERFASFLSQPLFHHRAIHQEVKCIESEFQNYLLDDSWRLYDLDRHLSKPGDSWAHFGVGNWGTLARTEFTNGPEEDGGRDWIPDLRARLCKWYAENYCATRMHMAIIGAASLDELTAMAVLHFSPIQHHLQTSLNASPKIDSPWGADQEGTVVLAKTVQDVQQIEVRWIVPTQTLLYRVKPLEFLSYFLHREGSGSLHEVLASRGWITSLHASRFGGDIERGFQSFYVHIRATAAGWRAWEAVVATVHKYIALVRDLVASDPEFAASVQKEICSRTELTYRFRGPTNTVSQAELFGAALSKLYPPEDVITGPFITEDWDASTVLENLAFLTPHKARVMLSGRGGWEDIMLHGRPTQEDATWNRAPWYNTEYKVLRLVPTDQSSYTPDDASSEGLRLRRGRSYLPEKLDILSGKVEGVESNPRPMKIHDTPLTELWYKMDDRFRVPKTCVVVKIATTVAGATPRRRLFTFILDKVIKRVLADDFNDAAYGLLECHIQYCDNGMVLRVYGFSEKVPVILGIAFNKLSKLVVTPEILHIAVEEVRKELQNKALAAPVDAAMELLDYLLSDYGWTAVEILGELDAINLSSIQCHLTEVLHRVHIRVLVNGNANEEDAMNILKVIEESLRSSPLSATERMSIFRRDLLLPEGCNFVHEVTVANPEDANSGLAFHCQVGVATCAKLRGTLAVLVRVIGNPIFNQLQVTEQLGYRVRVTNHSTGTTLSMRIFIQGTHDPAYLEQRVDACLDQMCRHLEQLTQDDLEKIKTPYMKSLRRGPVDIEKEAFRFWDRIFSGYHDFTRREEEAAAVGPLKTEDLLKFYDTYIRPGSSSRSKLSVWFKSAKCSLSVDGDRAMTSCSLLEDTFTFKQSLYPSRLPSRVGTFNFGCGSEGILL